MDPILILGINEFADLCGCFFNAEFHDLSLPSCNNGYNCKHQEQTEGTEVGDRLIGSCYAWSCPLGYPPSAYDLKKYGVLESGGEDEGEESNNDYIVVTDCETVQRLLKMGIKGLATRTMEEAEVWEEEHLTSERGDAEV